MKCLTPFIKNSNSFCCLHNVIGGPTLKKTHFHLFIFWYSVFFPRKYLSGNSILSREKFGKNKYYFIILLKNPSHRVIEYQHK